MSNELWDHAERIIRAGGHVKGKSKTPIAAMNRLFSEHHSGNPPFRISREDCAIRKETWPVEHLRRLVDPTEDEPGGEGEPVIAVETVTEPVVIDGRRRVNKASRRGSPVQMDVLTIAQKSPGG